MQDIPIWGIWLFILIASVVFELGTVGLTSIWFAGGAVVALIIYAAHGPLIAQIIAFVAVSLVLIIFTRPFALRFVNKKLNFKSNYEGYIGEKVRIVEDVDNFKETGKAILNGMEWTARTSDPSDRLSAGEEAIVTEVKGVKLILGKCQMTGSV